MEVRSNKIGDIRTHYQRKLFGVYPEREADKLLFMILEEFSGLSRAQILMDKEQTVSESELLKIHFGVKDLLKEKPIQYILGNTDFYGFKFLVNPNVLIPRPETEELIDLAIRAIGEKKNQKLLDVGTGSGCIAITLKKLQTHINITALDVSVFALEVARENASYHKTEVNFIQFDFLDESNHTELGYFDIIVSNPPYIPNREKVEMKRNVLEFEPHTALFVPDDQPLLFYKALGNFACKQLNEGGYLFCEINPNYAVELVKDYNSMDFLEVRLHEDMSGKQRFISCQR